MTTLAMAPSGIETTTPGVGRPQIPDDISSLRSSTVGTHPRSIDPISFSKSGVFVGDDEPVVRIVCQREMSNARWLNYTVGALVELLRLPKEWNSEHPQKIQPRAVVRMLETLVSILGPDTALPSVVPTTQGGVQVEWHQNRVDFENEATGSGRIEFYFKSPQEELEGPVEGDPGFLTRFTPYLKVT